MEVGLQKFSALQPTLFVDHNKPWSLGKYCNYVNLQKTLKTDILTKRVGLLCPGAYQGIVTLVMWHHLMPLISFLLMSTNED